MFQYHFTSSFTHYQLPISLPPSLPLSISPRSSTKVYLFWLQVELVIPFSAHRCPTWHFWLLGSIAFCPWKGLLRTGRANCPSQSLQYPVPVAGTQWLDREGMSLCIKEWKQDREHMCVTTLHTLGFSSMTTKPLSHIPYDQYLYLPAHAMVPSGSVYASKGCWWLQNKSVFPGANGRKE